MKTYRIPLSRTKDGNGPIHTIDVVAINSQQAQLQAELDRIRAKNGHGVTWDEMQFAVQWNAYTKKTVLYGSFNRDIPKKTIEPVRCAPQGSFTQKYGGKSEKTKAARSDTPRGFGKAFYLANTNHSEPWAA